MQIVAVVEKTNLLSQEVALFKSGASTSSQAILQEEAHASCCMLHNNHTLPQKWCLTLQSFIVNLVKISKPAY